MDFFIKLLASNWISILALGISFIALYKTDFQPFSLAINTAGRFSLSVNLKNSSQIAISPSLIFTNEGVRTGIVENLAIIITTPKNSKKILIPLLTLDDMGINSTKESKPLEATAFTGFSLMGKETVSKRIMFVPQSSEKFIFEQGDYLLEIFAKSSGDKSLKKSGEMKITIDSIDMSEIFKNIPNIKPGQTAYVEGAYFRDKTTLELDQAYESLKPYLK